MQKHTPRPWTVQQTGSAIDAYHAVNSRPSTLIVAKGGAVAEVFPCANPRRAFGDESLPDVTSDPFEPIGQTNALLIAAAPDLLQALMVAEARLAAVGSAGEQNVSAVAVAAALMPIRAAIAKAEGR